jgi:hypothetical protein
MAFVKMTEKHFMHFEILEDLKSDKKLLKSLIK